MCCFGRTVLSGRTLRVHNHSALIRCKPFCGPHTWHMHRHDYRQLNWLNVIALLLLDKVCSASHPDGVYHGQVCLNTSLTCVALVQNGSLVLTLLQCSIMRERHDLEIIVSSTMSKRCCRSYTNSIASGGQVPLPPFTNMAALVSCAQPNTTHWYADQHAFYPSKSSRICDDANHLTLSACILV